MNIKDINKKVKKIAQNNDFLIKKELYRGTYYMKDNLRNIIFSGIYKNKSAILKYYNDPRITDEPNSLSAFIKSNKSKVLTAPRIYKKKVISANEGWFIAEKIPKRYKHFTTPMNEKDKEEFLQIYLEYRKNFSKKPTRKLLHIEKLSPVNFYMFRINRWLELAQKREVERLVQGKKMFLDDNFFVVYEQVIEQISRKFKNRKMIWCHGHFKPHEVFADDEKNDYYLIDFAHSAMFPEGYELAFIIWSDYIMKSEKWNMSYVEWKKGIDCWVDELEVIAKKMKIKNPRNLLKVSLSERVVGTVFADILASDRPELEKKNGIKLMTKLLKDLIK